MKRITYENIVDKSDWHDHFVKMVGDEPDKIQWQDKDTGYPCLIVRNGMGALCGYVGVTKDHPLYGLTYDNAHDEYEKLMLDHLEVHGGLTFSDKCRDGNEHRCKEHGICHIVEDGEDDDVWWFGFDCAHALDIIPGLQKKSMSLYTGDNSPSYLSVTDDECDQYRNVGYVEHQCKHLASQLSECKRVAEQEVSSEVF